MRKQTKEQKRRKKMEEFFHSVKVQMKILNVPNVERMSKIQLSRFYNNSIWLESIGFVMVKENEIWWVKGDTRVSVGIVCQWPKYKIEQNWGSKY